MAEELLGYLLILPILYIIFFVVFTILKKIFPNFMNKENPFFCTVCASFFSVLILGFLTGFPSIILAFLLGMTTTGISVKSDQYLFFIKKKDYPAQFFIIQLILTMISLLIVIYIN